MAFALAFSILARADARPGPALLRVALPRAAAWRDGERKTARNDSTSRPASRTPEEPNKPSGREKEQSSARRSAKRKKAGTLEPCTHVCMHVCMYVPRLDIWVWVGFLLLLLLLQANAYSCYLLPRLGLRHSRAPGGRELNSAVKTRWW